MQFRKGPSNGVLTYDLINKKELYCDEMPLFFSLDSLKPTQTKHNMVRWKYNRKDFILYFLSNKLGGSDAMGEENVLFASGYLLRVKTEIIIKSSR